MNTENFGKLLSHFRRLKRTRKARKFHMMGWLGHRAVGPSYRSIYALKVHLSLAGIDQPVSATECGTVGCIAGHAALISGAPDDADIPTWARSWLGLTGDQADHLFAGDWSPQGLDASLTAAIRELERIIETGEVIPGEKSGR